MDSSSSIGVFVSRVYVAVVIIAVGYFSFQWATIALPMPGSPGLIFGTAVFMVAYFKEIVLSVLILGFLGGVVGAIRHKKAHE